MSESTNIPIQVIDTPIMLFDGTTVSKATAGAAAAVLLMPNGRRYTVSQFLSKATQEEADYQGLIIGLQKAQKLGIRKLEIKGDSQAIFYQIKGLAKAQEPPIQRLHEQVIKLINRFEKISFELIAPEQNRSAITAVNRCIAEALGRESPSNTTSSKAASITPNVTRLIKLGSNARDEDYKNLTPEDDDFSSKSLAQLRQLVPNSIRDEIALYWDGQDDHLTEIYRWYLRGLSPDMAIRKVQIDTDNKEPKQEEEKLPWEGELLVNSDLESPAFEPVNPFISSPKSDSLEITETPDLIFPFTEETEEDEDLPPMDESGTSPQPQAVPADSTLNKPEPSLITLIGDYSKDTLPSDAKVMHIVELVRNLSLEEKTLLVQELVKSGELVNLMLKAIAEQMSSGQG